MRVGDDALEFLAARAGGDARAALRGARAGLRDGAGRRGHAGARRGRAAAQGRALRPRGRPALRLHLGLDQGDARLDPDASLYYLAVMLEGGEDPRFIARRMVILASEDVGNADPQALQVAVAAAHAVEHVGLPEASSRSPRRRSTCRWRRSRTPPSARSARPGATSASTAPSRRPTTCAPAATTGPSSAGPRRRLRVPAPPPRAPVRAGAACPEGLENERFYEPDDGRGGAARRASRRSAGLVAATCDAGVTGSGFFTGIALPGVNLKAGT